MVAPVQGDVNSNCVGKCFLWPSYGDQSKGSSSVWRCQFGLRRSAASSRQRAIEAKVALARGIAKSNCIGAVLGQKATQAVVAPVQGDVSSNCVGKCFLWPS